MFGHDDVSDDDEAVTPSGLFEHGEEAITTAGETKERHPAVARACDKVQFASAIEAMQPAGHQALC